MSDINKVDESKNTNCKTTEEIKEIINELKTEKPDLSEELIIRGINACCSLGETKDFTGCVKEMIKQYELMKN